jgi:hypothetical protein
MTNFVFWSDGVIEQGVKFTNAVKNDKFLFFGQMV